MMQTTSERLNLLRKQQESTSQVYKPEFYRINNPQELLKFTQLLETPGITVVDHILEQITEFVKLKSPGQRFSTDELKLAAEKYIGDQDINAYGVWVYYPWSNRLVHILDKDEFVEVRTSRNQYKITREERDTLAGKKIGIIGLSVGQSVSVTLAMERICGELRLADFDLLELTNLNRIRTGVHNLGLAKVYSVAREIAEIDPFLKVLCFPEGLSESNLDDFFTIGGRLDLLVEESDGFDIKILSRYKARELKVPVIMEASDKCMVDVERFDLEPDRNILHGIVKHLDVDTLKTLKTNEEKIPYMLDVLGLSSTTPRLRASMLEMQQTISTWPQLGSAVTMGGGITADVSRRILLNHFTDSGRYYVDIDELIGNKRTEKKAATSGMEQLPLFTSEEMKRIAAEVKSSDSSEAEDADLGQIVEAGIASPSYGNKQPWQWLSHNRKLFLFKHNTYAANDPDEQNAYVSLGAAIENVILKAEEMGYKVSTALMPVPGKDLVAVFSFRKNRNAGITASLSPYIFTRHTNRQPGNGRPLKPAVLQELSAFADEIPGSRLSFITEAEKIEKVAAITGRAEQMRLLNPLLHEDYFKNEIRWNTGAKITEGIDVKALALPPSVETAFEVISDARVAALLNAWDKGIAFRKLTAGTVAASAALGLITMPDNSVESMLNGGRLAEKIWLAATKNNLAFQPICLPLTLLKFLGNKSRAGTFTDKNISELNELKEGFSLIFNELNTRKAMFLFRLFNADKTPDHSLRKPLNEVYSKS